MDSNHWFLLESTQLISTPVFPRNNCTYKLYHHNFAIDTVLTLSTRDVEHFCHCNMVSLQQRECTILLNIPINGLEPLTL